MNTIYQAMDYHHKTKLTDASDYEGIIKWAFMRSKEYELIQIKTTWDYCIPSNKVISFVFKRV